MKKWTYPLIAIGVAFIVAIWSFNKASPVAIHPTNVQTSFAFSHNLISKPLQSEQKVLQSASNQAKLLYQQGVAAFSNKDYSKAIHLENEAITADRTFYEAYNVLGIAQCYAGDFTNGIGSIHKALQLAPNDGYARFNQALALELYGHYDEAITAYHETLKLKSSGWWTPWCYYGIASIYGRRGDVAGAVHYLSQAIHLDSSIKNEARTEQDFDNVRNSDTFQALIQ